MKKEAEERRTRAQGVNDVTVARNTSHASQEKSTVPIGILSFIEDNPNLVQATD